MSRSITVFLVIIVVIFFHLKLLRFSTSTDRGELKVLICLGQVIAIDTSEKVDQILTLRISSGKFRRQTVTVDNIWTGNLDNRKFDIADRLLIEIPLREFAQETAKMAKIRGHFRTPFLLDLAGLIVALMILVGGSKGVRAIITIFATVLTVFFVICPLIIKGFDPVIVSFCASIFLTLLTFLLISGFNKKTTAGIIGTLSGLFTVLILAIVSQKVLHLTGLAEEFGQLQLGLLLKRMPETQNWEFHKILIAGIIFASVGAVMDVAMSIASSLHELRKIDPNLSRQQLFRSGMNVGQDVMGTMVDTLIFAYVGTEISILILPYVDFPELGKIYPFLRLINSEMIAVTVCLALSGTIGVTLTVPITAIVASRLMTKLSISRHKNDINNLSLQIPIALLFLLILTISIDYFVTRSSAPIFEQKSENGEIIAVSEFVKGRVVRQIEQVFVDRFTSHEVLEVKLLSGLHAGKKIVMRNVLNRKMPLLTIPATVGDQLLCRVSGSKEKIESISLIQEYGRDRFLIWLFGLLMIVVVLAGRAKGIRTILALWCSGITMHFFALPMLTRSDEPVLIITLTSGLVAFCSLIFVSGANRKTIAALLGTVASTAIAGSIILFAQERLNLSGLENSSLAEISTGTGELFNFRHLLVAGILMGMLGVAVDGAIEVASSMTEVLKIHRKISIRRLMISGMNIGTDILGTMVNTLFFAYFGMRLLLLMAMKVDTLRNSLFAGSMVELLSIEVNSVEVLRLLAGTLGLILTIPSTAIICLLFHQFLPTEFETNSLQSD